VITARVAAARLTNRSWNEDGEIRVQLPKEFSFESSLNPRKLPLEGVRIDHITRLLSLSTLLDEIQLTQFGKLHERRTQLYAISRLAELTGIECSYSWTREMAGIAILRTVCADRFALSSSMNDEAKAKGFGWHNEARLKALYVSRRNSDLRQLSDYIVPPHGLYDGFYDDENDFEHFQLFPSRKWVAVEDDIRIVSRFLFEEERAGRQRYQLLRRRLSDSQLLLEYRVGEEESRRVKMVQEACEEI
jgi:hypothetical protein